MDSDETYVKWKLWDWFFEKNWNFEFLTIFTYFFSNLNIWQIRIFENDEKHRKCSSLEKKIVIFFSKIFKICFSNSFQLAESYRLLEHFFTNMYRSLVKIRNVKSVFRFPRFSGIPYINSLRKWWWSSENPDSW